MPLPSEVQSIDPSDWVKLLTMQDPMWAVLKLSRTMTYLQMERDGLDGASYPTFY
jgi:hypothetical protein